MSLRPPRYKGRNLGNSLFGFAASLIPQCGYDGFSKITPFVLAAILAGVGLQDEITAEQIVNTMPSDKKLKMVTERHAIETVLPI
eukprot:15366547-Ditylum_brightwellii.AAC.1